MSHDFRKGDNTPRRSRHKLVINDARLRDDLHIIDVDLDQSRWFHMPVRDLGSFGREKFENWVILEHTDRRIKVRYV